MTKPLIGSTGRILYSKSETLLKGRYKMESFYRYIISVPYYKLIEIESIIQNICAENIKKCGIETRYYYTIKRTNIDDTQSYYVMENSPEFSIT